MLSINASMDFDVKECCPCDMCFVYLIDGDDYFSLMPLTKFDSRSAPLAPQLTLRHAVPVQQGGRLVRKVVGQAHQVRDGHHAGGHLVGGNSVLSPGERFRNHCGKYELKRRCTNT